MFTPRRFHVAALAFLAATLALPAAAAAAPKNDNFADAEVLEGERGNAEGTNYRATKEPLEPDHAGNAGGRSVWFRWTAPQDGQIGMATFGSDFDTLLAVYTGPSLGDVIEVASSEDAGHGERASMLSFRARAGTVYHVAVDGFGGKVGRVRLTWMPAPANDNFVDADAITGLSGRVRGTIVGATWEAGEPLRAGMGASVWYVWTAPTDGPVSFDTTGSGFDTVLSVFTGTDVAELELLAENDDDPFLGCCASRLDFDAVAGRSYAIAVDSFGDDWGPSVLTWRPLVRGTPAKDVIVGTAENEEIRGLGGRDTIRAGGGDDLVFAGPGDDVVVGGGGDDLLLGQAGSDRIVDRSGRDTLNGGGGNDRLNARDSAGGDALRGGPGRDACAADRRDVTTSCP